jgi:hypothetical protein
MLFISENICPLCLFNGHLLDGRDYLLEREIQGFL